MLRHAPSAGAPRLLGVKVLAALAMALGYDPSEFGGKSFDIRRLPEAYMTVL